MSDATAETTPGPLVTLQRQGLGPAAISTQIATLVLTAQTPIWWFLALGISSSLLLLLAVGAMTLLAWGVGVWGLAIPVAWGLAIINFVWWIGIGHAGTLISAVLLLLRQEWRTSINRFAEAMTLFAVACAGLFPLLHMGRPWLFYWMMPHPNTLALWPQFRSPLIWDVFAVTTYATVSLLFWYVGLIPDLAVLRDRTRNAWARIVYGIGALGWRGSATHWYRYETAYFLLAALATPLVVSVHTVVGLDFATSLVPGWHATIFPPYFVAGAIFSGFAMVVTLAVPLRRAFGLEHYITTGHLDNMGKVMLATGLIVAYGYGIEAFTAWYSGNVYERGMLALRTTGPYAVCYWALLFCNVLIPQLLWLGAVRRSPWILWLVALVVNVGMWLERFVIVVTSLATDFLPGSWGMYTPTIWDWSLYLGTLGLFFTLMLLFVRFLPLISIFEMQALLPQPAHGEETRHG
jgi:molybdopterin-containing oxidoreductase family membrane subunit